MHHASHRQLFIMRAACILAALVASALSEASHIRFETRALTGTDGPLGPGLGVGVNFLGFNNPVLNSSGQIAFTGTLTGSGVTGFVNDVGIWSEGGGAGLALVARSGDNAPGTATGVNFSGLSLSPVLNDAGQIAFASLLTGAEVTSANNDSIWSNGSGSGLTLVAREGSPAPGTGAGVNFSGFNPPVLNGAGQIAFFGGLTGTGVSSANDAGIWSEGGGSGLALIAREGNNAPGTAAGVNFRSLTPIRLNGAGQTAFYGRLTGTDVTSANEFGIWSEGAGPGLALVARGGDAAPGTATGVNFASFGFPVLNGAGQIAFSGVLTGAGVTDENDRGIWSEGGGTGLALVAREGIQAPGLAAGVNFGALQDPVLNGAGQTAFTGFLTGEGVTSANRYSIWSEGGGSGLALVARTGQQAPGADPGAVFGNFGLNPVLNGEGQTAFAGFLTGGGGGIWATDSSGQLHLIARTGDPLDVSNDPLSPDPRTISSLTLVTGSGGEDGRATSFNDAGQLALLIGFTDGSSGIFVATISDPTATYFKLTITPATTPDTGYDLEWESQPGKVYDLVTATDLATPTLEWPVYDPDGEGGNDPYGDIVATGPTTKLTAVPGVGPNRFFVVIEKDAPPADNR
jgi:hypothetical protein